MFLWYFAVLTLAERRVLMLTACAKQVVIMNPLEIQYKTMYNEFAQYSEMSEASVGQLCGIS